MKAAGADQPVTARKPRRRFVASLLYGRNVDRTAKTRARLGLAVLIFSLGYAIIAARLQNVAAMPEGHVSRRPIAQVFEATSRCCSLSICGENPSSRWHPPPPFPAPQPIVV